MSSPQVRPTTHIGDTRLDRVFGRVNYVVLGAFTLAVLYPLVYVLSASVSEPSALTRGEVWLWPVGLNVDAYKAIWESPRLVTGFTNSVLYTITGALFGTAMTMLAGYVIARHEMPFRRFLTLFCLVPTLLSAGIIPNYLVVRSLGLLNTPWAVILPGAMSVFNVLITRTFYQMNVPDELHEAARVDGANEFATFFRIALPLSKPIIAVNLLFYGVAQWNAWFNAFLYLNDDGLFPLQLVLRELLTQSAVDPSALSGANLAEIMAKKELFDKLKYAMIVVAMIPPLIAYPFVQKHFVKGALIGSVK
ncbi:carbohydrate ABC transporter permease [Microlunatus sp. Y2014]|uniref:carbohydrate ABC transporter permease n=1 Tax=Microlunatus sp. Y2014 TaxID=3418488 RepID=UPI003DA78EC2